MMKLFALFCFLATATFSYGQTGKPDNDANASASVKKPEKQRVAVSVNGSGSGSSSKPFSLREDAVATNADWHFKAGDSSRWASPAYIDSHWTVEAGPSANIRSNKTLWEQEKGWFRLWIRSSKPIDSNSLTMVIAQFGRSEVYLDGKLLIRMVPPRIDSGGSQRILKFVPIPVADTNRHLLAIRYAFRKEPTFFADVGEAPFDLDIKRTDEAGTAHYLSESASLGIDFLIAGILGILSLLHFLFFRANKAQRINRTLCWTMLAFSIAFLTNFLSDITPNLTIDSFVELLERLSMRAGFVLLLGGVYQYLNIKEGWFFYGILGLLVLDLLHRVVLGPLPYYTGGIALTLAFVDYVRLSWLGRKRKEADSRLPWNSLKMASLCLVGMVVVIILGAITRALIHFDFDLMLAPLFVLGLIALLCIPVGLSLSLVQDYTRTYRSLENNLREVEQLSARTVAQEQEKQQILARQNETLEHLVTERTAALDQSLAELKATQDQLIQREKLASLGELTAGVAHEIQNPLNFVNNFSEVSVDLLTELEEEQARPDAERDVDLEKELLGDLKQNIGKIGHHGQRAASIVRGMLQHSQTSAGKREPTDLNALTDEYLRLAYHGIRAKDHSVDVSLVTQFDPNLPLVSVVGQEIGRVLMNLFTNAFYAVQERTQQTAGTYRPTVTVSTAGVGETVQIRVHDNGTGIPDEVRSKIFQPFFTTKPTGKGTGLGLSLSYDIITKGHGGTITVNTQSTAATPDAGTFTEFIITL